MRSELESTLNSARRWWVELNEWNDDTPSVRAQVEALALFAFLCLAFLLLFAADYGSDPIAVVFVSLLLLSSALGFCGPGAAAARGVAR